MVALVCPGADRASLLGRSCRIVRPVLGQVRGRAPEAGVRVVPVREGLRRVGALARPGRALPVWAAHFSRRAAAGCVGPGLGLPGFPSRALGFHPLRWGCVGVVPGGPGACSAVRGPSGASCRGSSGGAVREPARGLLIGGGPADTPTACRWWFLLSCGLDADCGRCVCPSRPGSRLLRRGPAGHGLPLGWPCCALPSSFEGTRVVPGDVGWPLPAPGSRALSWCASALGLRPATR